MITSFIWQTASRLKRNDDGLKSQGWQVINDITGAPFHGMK
jgi:hypothetical protein